MIRRMFDESTELSSGETRNRRRRHMVTAAAGFAVGIALVVGSMSSPATSSATPSATLYDSWGSSAWPFDQPSDREESEQTPREARTNTDANGEPEVLASTETTEDDTIVVTGEEPIAVSIPAMGAAAEVIPVGLDEGGGVFVPEDVRTLGWYTASMPVAADRGSSVIVGHRDSAAQGAGTFSGIENLQPGEVVEVTTADGGTQVYTVTEILMVDKDEFATIAGEAFALEGEHRLTLITCGGAFDAAARSYESNVFVIATPGTA